MADILFPRIGGAIEPQGPQTRAFMAEARFAVAAFCYDSDCDRSTCQLPAERMVAVQSTPADMAVVDTIAEVLNHRRLTDGYGDEWDALSVGQIDEAARAVAQLLLLNFEITPR